jgi:hypothetical protein
MEEGGGSSLGTARSTHWHDVDDAHSQASSRRADRGKGAEEGAGASSEFGNTRWQVPTPAQVLSWLMPGLEGSGLDSSPSSLSSRTRTPQVC